MVRKPQRWSRQEISVEDLAAAGRMCAWHGCLNTCEGDLPPDWINLLTWWWPQPSLRGVAEIVMSEFCTRDAVLCGEHARQLERLLKPTPPIHGSTNRLAKPDKGRTIEYGRTSRSQLTRCRPQCLASGRSASPARSGGVPETAGARRRGSYGLEAMLSDQRQLADREPPAIMLLREQVAVLVEGVFP